MSEITDSSNPKPFIWITFDVFVSIKYCAKLYL